MALTEKPVDSRGGTGATRPCLLYVLHSGTLYGTERMGLVTVEALREYKRRVILAPPSWSNGSVPEVLDAAAVAGLEALRYDGRKSLVAQLGRVFRTEPAVDVITTSITQSLLVTAVATATRTRLRHLHAVHGGETTDYRMKRLLVPLNLRFMAVSTHVKRILAEVGVPEGKIVVAENFLTPPAGSTAASRDSYEHRGIRTDGAPARIVVVARPDPVKRLDLLVDAVATGGLDGMQIDVFGYGPDIDRLRRRAEPYQTLQFHGYAADIASRLAEADVFLHTCDVETFGLAVLEAFQAGVVAVVPDAGGTGTLVKHDVTGLLYKAGDVADMVRAVRRAAGMSSVDLDRLVNNARDEISSRFSSEHGARVYRQAFDDVEHAGRSRRLLGL